MSENTIINLRCLIVDDEMHVINSLTRLIFKTEGITLVGFETDPIEALNKINSGLIAVDIVFMDISMPEMDGIELAGLIGHKVRIIFLTAHEHFALEAFEVGAVDYLLKPLNEDHFIRAIKRAEKIIKNEQLARVVKLDYIFLKLDSRNIVQIMLDDLICIEVENKLLRFHTIASKKIEVNKPLNSFEEILVGNGFIRVHKSYLVNTKYISGIVGNQLLLKNDIMVLIGPTYKEALYKLMNPR